MNELNETKSFAVKENLNLKVNCKNIGMYVKGSESHEVVISVAITLNKEVTLDDLFTIDYNETENELIIVSKETDDLKIRKTSVTLEVPKTSNIKIKSKNGGFKVKDINNYIDAESQNGKLSLKRINSNISCKTTNGKISLKEIVCDKAEIISSNGSIKLYDVNGDISINNKNGMIKCTDCEGNLNINGKNGRTRILDSYLNNADIQLINGSIYYEFNSIKEGNFKFDNENGKIHLIIPSDIPYDIKAINKLGRFYVGLPGDYEQIKKDNRKQISMTRESGQVKIIAENKHGSITLIDKNKIDKNINFGGFGDEISTLINSINSEEIQEKIQKKIDKAREKLRKLSIKDPKIFENADKATANLTKEIKDAISDENLQKAGKNIASKVKVAVKNFVKDTKQFTKAENLYNSKTDNDKAQSRLKILQMLEEGKINTEEAEKLLNALEK